MFSTIATQCPVQLLLRTGPDSDLELLVLAEIILNLCDLVTEGFTHSLQRHVLRFGVEQVGEDNEYAVHNQEDQEIPPGNFLNGQRGDLNNENPEGVEDEVSAGHSGRANLGRHDLGGVLLGRERQQVGCDLLKRKKEKKKETMPLTEQTNRWTKGVHDARKGEAEKIDADEDSLGEAKVHVL